MLHRPVPISLNGILELLISIFNGILDFSRVSCSLEQKFRRCSNDGLVKVRDALSITAGQLLLQVSIQ